MIDFDTYLGFGKTDSLYEKLNSEAIATFPKVVQVYDDQKGFYSPRIGHTASRYVEINGTRYFVKYPTLGGNAEYAFFIEAFVAYLAKKVGIKCIDPMILVDHKAKALGIISLDFGEHITYADFGYEIDYGGKPTSVNEILTNIEKRLSLNYSDVVFDKQQMLETLNKIACFDYLTDQMDRHSQNLAFIISEKDGKKVLEIAPLYDNASAFLHQSGRFFRLSPNSGTIFGLEQQNLLNSEFQSMLDAFSDLFSEENYNSTIQDFNAQYGIKEILGEKVFNRLAHTIQRTVNKQIKNCEYRKNPEIHIPLEAVYAIVKRHSAELEQDDTLCYFLWDICQYYGIENYNKSHNNFYKEIQGEFQKFEWYEECKELALNPDNDEMKVAKVELESQKRQFCLDLINAILKNNIVLQSESSLSFYLAEVFRYLLLNDKSFCKTKRINSKDNGYALLQALGFLYEIYKELDNWCYEQECNGLNLDKKGLKEYKKIKKTLKKYIRFVNAYTNKNLSPEDAESLKMYNENSHNKESES